MRHAARPHGRCRAGFDPDRECRKGRTSRAGWKGVRSGSAIRRPVDEPLDILHPWRGLGSVRPPRCIAPVCGKCPFICLGFVRDPHHAIRADDPPSLDQPRDRLRDPGLCLRGSALHPDHAADGPRYRRGRHRAAAVQSVEHEQPDLLDRHIVDLAPGPLDILLRNPSDLPGRRITACRLVEGLIAFLCGYELGGNGRLEPVHDPRAGPVEAP